MLKKTITYEDFNGNERTKDFYFHMNQVEFTKLNGDVPGGLEKRLQKIIEDQDEDALLRIIDMIVSRSYGEFDDDEEFTKIGRHGRPLYEKFVNTDAYDCLIKELIQNENNIVEFMKGVMPKKIQGELDKKIQERREENKIARLTPVGSEEDPDVKNEKKPE